MSMDLISDEILPKHKVKLVEYTEWSQGQHRPVGAFRGI